MRLTGGARDGYCVPFVCVVSPFSLSNRWVGALRLVSKHGGNWISNMLKIVLAPLNGAPKSVISPNARPIREWTDALTVSGQTL